MAPGRISLQSTRQEDKTAGQWWRWLTSTPTIVTRSGVTDAAVASVAMYSFWRFCRHARVGQGDAAAGAGGPQDSGEQQQCVAVGLPLLAMRVTCLGLFDVLLSNFKIHARMTNNKQLAGDVPGTPQSCC
jgi:hypothetical protein